MYGIIKGKPPAFFFDKDKIRTLTGLYFNVEDEVFEFYAPVKMQDNPLWIDVTELMKSVVGQTITRLDQKIELGNKNDSYLNRFLALSYMKDTVDLHIEDITGEDKTVLEDRNIKQ